MQEVIYHIIDQPPPANDSTWYRVAAIVVTGAGWQFKDYPFEVCLGDLSLCTVSAGEVLSVLLARLLLSCWKRTAACLPT